MSSNETFGTMTIAEFFNGDPKQIVQRYVFTKLLEIARGLVRHESSTEVNQNPSLLVNELFLKWHTKPPKFQDKKHFYNCVRLAMQRMLISFARKRNAQKNGGQFQHEGLDESAMDMNPSQLLALSNQLGVPLLSSDTKAIEDVWETLDKIKKISTNSYKIMLCKLAGFEEKEISEELVIGKADEWAQLDDEARRKKIRSLSRIARDTFIFDLEKIRGEQNREL